MLVRGCKKCVKVVTRRQLIEFSNNKNKRLFCLSLLENNSVFGLRVSDVIAICMMHFSKTENRTHASTSFFLIQLVVQNSHKVSQGLKRSAD